MCGRASEQGYVVACVRTKRSVGVTSVTTCQVTPSMWPITRVKRLFTGRLQPVRWIVVHTSLAGADMAPRASWTCDAAGSLVALASLLKANIDASTQVCYVVAAGRQAHSWMMALPWGHNNRTQKGRRLAMSRHSTDTAWYWICCRSMALCFTLQMQRCVRSTWC